MQDRSTRGAGARKLRLGLRSDCGKELTAEAKFKAGNFSTDMWSLGSSTQ